MAEPGPLRYAVLEVTNRCNLRCPHCGSSSGLARDDELSLDELRALIAEIVELGGEEITVIGGEALLHPHWYEICRAVSDAGARLLLLTNGLLLARDESAFRKLCRLSPYLVGVSIDGASRESYRRLRGVDGLDEAVRLCHRLVDAGCEHVNAVTTFWRDNLSEFDAFAALFRDTPITWQVQMANKGGDRFADGQFLSLQDYRWLTTRMKALLTEDSPRVALCPMDDFGYFPLDPALGFLHESWRGCMAGVEVVGIRSNGDVLGCLSLGDAFVEDNVRRRPLAEIWQDPASFTSFRRKGELLTGHCAACPMAERCSAGCSAIAYSATGTIGDNPYCLRHLEASRIVDLLVDDG